MRKNRLLRATVLAVACSLSMAVFAQGGTPKAIDIPPGDLVSSLQALTRQSGAEFVYREDLLAGLRTQGVRGTLTAEQALEKLLEGSGFAVKRDPSGALMILKSDAVVPKAEPQAGERNVPATSQTAEVETQDLEKITVTGTRLRGVQPSSPLLMISQEEMRLAGHNRLEDVIRAIPQNFSGGQNPGVLPGVGGAQGNTNITGAATLNLRGLGSDSTLSLLNGSRLAYDSFTQATDIAVIPVAAIDRMEVLLDGASSVYGSDAVAGVANIVLKRDFDGAELSARYGEATEGGYEQTQVSAVVGNVWASGGLLVAAESTSTSSVDADQRDYLDYIANGHLLMIYPRTSQRGVLVSGYQSVGQTGEFAVDGFYTKRSMQNDIVTTVWSRTATEAVMYGFAPSLSVGVGGDWTMRLFGTVSDNKSEGRGTAFSLATGMQQGAEGVTTYSNRTVAAGVEFEGVLLHLPAGDARASIGGGWRELDFSFAQSIAAAGINVSSRHAYGEINLPLVASTQGIPLVHRLWLNGGIRYEDYNIYGHTSTPKVGMTWEMTPDLTLRASWGKSFKIPTMFQQAGVVQAVLQPASVAGITDVPPDATFLSFNGGNSDLMPERAEVVTAGFNFRPSFLPGASMELGFFRIDYTQRVTTPLQFPNNSYWGQTLNDPRYARFVTANPPESQQAELIELAGIFSNFLPGGAVYDPSKVVAIFDNRSVNSAAQLIQGIDLDVRHTFEAFDSIWSFHAAGSWITESKRRLVAGGPESDTAGVVAYPPRFKGRLGGSWSRERLTASLNFNHIGGARDTRGSTSPKIDGMTTVDFTLDLASAPESFGGVGLSLSIFNAFNNHPPSIAPSLPFFVNYDSTNFSPLGRVVSVSVTKRF